MKRRSFSWALAATACSALLLTSCSTTSTRISEHPEIYNSLSPSDQALVSQGQVRDGMTMGAVYLAWGSPDQKALGRVKGRPAETWIYTATTDAYPYGSRFGGLYGRSGYFRHHRYYRPYGPYYDPFYYTSLDLVKYPYKTVSFQNGRAVVFQGLYPPRFY